MSSSYGLSIVTFRCCSNDFRLLSVPFKAMKSSMLQVVLRGVFKSWMAVCMVCCCCCSFLLGVTDNDQLVVQAIEDNDCHQKGNDQGIREVEEYLLRRNGDNSLDVKFVFCSDRVGYCNNLLIFRIFYGWNPVFALCRCIDLADM